IAKVYKRWGRVEGDVFVWLGTVDEKERDRGGEQLEICGGKEDDVGLVELEEGGKCVVSKIVEFGGDLGSELFGDRGGDDMLGISLKWDVFDE
ncbi:hypothetical protein Tco_1435814, partial [Tanacetum coccineum]